MALVYADRVQETTATTGTGVMTLGGAALGFRTFLNGVGVSNQAYYAIEDTTTGDWEVGLGTLTTGTTWTRNSVLASSNANMLVSFAVGVKKIYTVSPASFFAGALLTAAHATTDHTGLPGVPAAEAFTAPVHAATDHTGLPGVPAAEAFTALVHAGTDHTGVPGVGDLSTAAHAVLDHGILPGVIPLRQQVVSTNITITPVTLYSVPANTLSADNDALEFEWWVEGLGAGGTNLAVEFGGASLVTAVGNPDEAFDRQVYKLKIVRTGVSSGVYQLDMADYLAATGTSFVTSSKLGKFGTTAVSWAAIQALTMSAANSDRSRITYVKAIRSKAA